MSHSYSFLSAKGPAVFSLKDNWVILSSWSKTKHKHKEEDFCFNTAPHCLSFLDSVKRWGQNSPFKRIKGHFVTTCRNLFGDLSNHCTNLVFCNESDIKNKPTFSSLFLSPCQRLFESDPCVQQVIGVLPQQGMARITKERKQRRRKEFLFTFDAL